ncbi:MAG: DUF559 domain-containing protein [bacterium]|nr:DUF559 domain-containing protein [bacterium]
MFLKYFSIERHTMFDEKELVDLYVENKFSGRQVAERTGIYLGKVQEILKKHGVARRLSDAQKVLYEKGYQHPLKIKLNENEIIRQFLAGKSLPQLAKEYGCSVTPLRRILRENNTPLRKRIVNESAVVWLYLNERLSGREISKRMGHSLLAIQKILKKNKIARTLKEARSNLFQKGYNHPFKKDLDAAKVIDFYTLRGVSIPRIAKLFECSLAPILRLLKENKIPIKSPSESHKGNPGYWGGKKRPELSIKLKGRKISEKTREKLRVSHLGQKSTKKGKTYEEIYGEKAKYLKEKLKISHLGQVSVQKRKNFEELYGTEKAGKIKEKLSRKTKERFSSEEARKTQSERILKFIEEHPEWRELKKKQSAEYFMRNPEKVKAHAQWMKQYYSNSENKQKMVERAKRHYREHPERLENMSRIHKAIWSTPEKKEYARQRRFKQNFPFRHTLPERSVFDEMQQRGIKFEKHKTVLNMCQPDAVIDGMKIAIFVDGDYWHAHPEKYKDKQLTKAQTDKVRRDKEQNEALKKNGWVILRFWESEIKRDVSSCVGEVEKYLKNKLQIPLSTLEVS